MFLSTAKSFAAGVPLNGAPTEIIEISDSDEEKHLDNIRNLNSIPPQNLKKILQNGSHENGVYLVPKKEDAKGTQLATNGFKQGERSSTSLLQKIPINGHGNDLKDVQSKPASTVLSLPQTTTGEKNTNSSWSTRREQRRRLQVTLNGSRSHSTSSSSSYSSSEVVPEGSMEQATKVNHSIIDPVHPKLNEISSETFQAEADDDLSDAAVSTEPEQREPSAPLLQNQKRFLKPFSPRKALTRADLASMSLDDVEDSITKHGTNIVGRLSLKDILAKGISEIKPPPNVKLTPQLRPKLQFKKPISADDEVIVISDSDAAADSGSQETDSECVHQEMKRKFRSQRDFLSNFQLSHRIRSRRPRKRDIVSILKTRNIIKAYIVNPLVNVLKADCIYKYVTTRKILSSEQFRAQRDANRRRGRSTNDQLWSQVKRRRSSKKTATKTTQAAQTPKKVFMTAKFLKKLAGFEKKGIWTSYSSPQVTSKLSVPFLFLNRVNQNDWQNHEEPNLDGREKRARPKETKCKWCRFRCLNIPSLELHCKEVHNKELE